MFLPQQQHLSGAVIRKLMSPFGGSISTATLLNPQRLVREICCNDFLSESVREWDTKDMVHMMRG